MKVLILSLENWNNNVNGGNVLSNIFSGLNFEIEQIYCSAGLPNTTLCNKYYQITDKMVIDNVLKGKEIGRIFESDFNNSDDFRFENKSKKGKRWEITFLIRELFWKLSKIDNKNFVSFIKDFNPDIIFAPCYGNVRMLRLTRLVSKYTSAPIVSYVSDDLYSYNVINFNPLFWIRRWNLRRNVRKTSKLYSLMYTMTNQQLQEYEKELNVPMKILRKGCKHQGINFIKKPYKIIFAGNLYLNRSDVLCKLAEVIGRYNKDKLNFVLEIYSGSSLSKEQYNILNNGYDTFFNGLIDSEQLKAKYKECSIALHVESFNLKNSLITRLSFSTKITDCLQSGAALMAICPANNAGFQYLRDEDCAICIDNIDDIDFYINKIMSDENYLKTYAEKAKDCIERNHVKSENDKMIIEDFYKVIKNKKVY